jgi:very-short-patch-repair endonuclease/predicted RNA-binding Zn-ribbon protein involved in translation (DUF1610 family)
MCIDFALKLATSVNTTSTPPGEALGGLVVLVIIIALVVVSIQKAKSSSTRNTNIDTSASEGWDLPQKKAEKQIYFKQDWFFSRAERSFFGVLEQVVDADKFRIFAKIRLADVLYVGKGLDNSQRATAQNKINHKHVDFIIYTADTIQPVCAIELDDSSHANFNRQQRDVFFDRAMKNAGLPLLRVPVAFSYNPHELAQKLTSVIGEVAATGVTAPQTAESASPAEPATNTPSCPKCGAEMIMRTTKTGRNRGQTFWGCSNYPKCRGIIPA